MKQLNIEKQFLFRVGILFGILVMISFMLSMFFLPAIDVSAFASNQQASGVTIGTAAFGNSFTPALATIQVGETVTFTNSGLGFHNVVFDDEVPGGLVPDGFKSSPATSQPWTVTVKFDEPGNYFFFCTPHKDDGMIGRITVEAPEIYIPLIVQ